MTRESLIALLQEQGFVAIARDWAMGETTLVSHDRLKFEHHEITGYSDAAYVRQDADGRWTMTDSIFAEHRYETLEQVLDELEKRFRANR